MAPRRSHLRRASIHLGPSRDCIPALSVLFKLKASNHKAKDAPAHTHTQNESSVPKASDAGQKRPGGLRKLQAAGISPIPAVAAGCGTSDSYSLHIMPPGSSMNGTAAKRPESNKTDVRKCYCYKHNQGMDCKDGKSTKHLGINPGNSNC